VLIERALIAGVEPAHRFCDLAVHIGNCLQHSLAGIFRLIGVAHLQRFVLAGGGAGRHRGAAANSSADVNVGLNGGIAARIDNLARVDSSDLRGHFGMVSSAVVN
jgi:hypothetical protein